MCKKQNKENFLFVDVSDSLQNLNPPPLLGHAQISFYPATLQIRCSKKWNGQIKSSIHYEVFYNYIKSSCGG